MVISQLLVNTIEWNKFHFVANLIAFKMTPYILQFFPGDENPTVQFFSDTVCISIMLYDCLLEQVPIIGTNHSVLVMKVTCPTRPKDYPYYPFMNVIWTMDFYGISFSSTFSQGLFIYYFIGINLF